MIKRGKSQEMKKKRERLLVWTSASGRDFCSYRKVLIIVTGGEDSLGWKISVHERPGTIQKEMMQLVKISAASITNKR